MSVAPSYVAVKRRRDESPLSALVLEERQAKYRRQHVEYRLQSTSTTQPALSQSGVPHIKTTQPVSEQSSTSASSNAPHEQIIVSGNVVPAPHDAHNDPVPQSLKRTEAKRTFSLAPPLAGRKRGAEVSDELPTFIESKRLRMMKGANSRQGPRFPVQKPVERISSPPRQKRAGTSIRRPAEAVKSVSTLDRDDTQQAPSKELSDALHAFALEELAREHDAETDHEPEPEPEPPKSTFVSPVKPAIKFQPKPTARLRDRVAHSNGTSTPDTETGVRLPDEDTAMDDYADDAEDFVYDIYMRHSTSAAAVEAAETDVSGVLVITEQDEPLWQTYLEESEDGDGRFDTDDEDENAEGYYGADYPEDEVASDDEFGAGAYGYRRGDSDDEQWDREAWSEGEDEIGEPWKRMPWINAPGMGGPGRVRDDDDNDEI